MHSYEFVVEYKEGRENVAAYSLSRRDEADENALLIVIVVESDWVDQVRAMVQADSYFQKLNTK